MSERHFRQVKPTTPPLQDGARECCDEMGGAKTYGNQAQMAIRGKVYGIDWCIHQIVAALNAGGIPTEASCCGHKEMAGRIDLLDGRTLIIVHSDPWHPRSERDESGRPVTDALAEGDRPKWLTGMTGL